MGVALFGRYWEFAKYTLASGLALAVDYGVYILLVKSGGLALPAAATYGYAAGLIFAYFLISKKVFNNGRLKKRRRTEFTLFLVSGLLGVGITYSTSALVVALLGNHLNAAKLTAVAVSFIVVYVFRKCVVFSNK